MQRAPAIDFYLYATHEVETWLPIIQRLRAHGADARFILEPPGQNVTRGTAPDQRLEWATPSAPARAHLVDSETFDALNELLADHGEQPLDRRRARADAAVTTQSSRWLRFYPGTRIRTMYGVGFVTDAYGHGPINVGFDLVLAHGAYSRDSIAAVDPTVHVEVVGYPKWAKYLRGELTPGEARSRLGIQRPCIAWVPTWAANSSLDDYVDAVAQLASTHQVLLKPHHNNSRFERQRLARAAHSGITVLPASTSLVDLLAAASVVICDPRSGGFTEAILADRPAIALLRATANGSALHPGALECATICSSPNGLEHAVNEALKDPCAELRRNWRGRLFIDLGGNDDEVAAKAILDSIVKPSPMRRSTAAFWSAIYEVTRRLGR